MSKRRITILGVLFWYFIILNSGKAQVSDSSRIKMKGMNTVFFEIFGPGYMSSINYSRVIYDDGKIILAPRIGFGGSFLANVRGWNIPLELNLLLGKGTHYFESGLGLGYHSYTTKLNTSSEDKSFNTLNMSLRIGYRYQPPKNGLFFNIAFTPMFSVGSTAWVRNSEQISIGNPFQPWMGLGVGYSFNKNQ